MAVDGSPELAAVDVDGKEANPPKPLTTGDAPKKGSPTTPALARGKLKDTMDDRMANSLAHHCDFGINLSRRIGLKKYFKAIAQAIRTAIRGIKRALGLGDASGVISTIINKVKAIVQEINNYVKQYVKPIQQFLIKVIKFIAYVKKVIAWIISLPARFLKYLRECLTALMSALSKVFLDELFSGEPGSTIGKDISAVLKEAKQITTTISTTIALANQTVASVQSLGTTIQTALGKSASSVSGASTLSSSQSTLTQTTTSDTANTATKTIVSISNSIPTTSSIANSTTSLTSSATQAPNTSTV
jgi:hypothetical protein